MFQNNILYSISTKTTPQCGADSGIEFSINKSFVVNFRQIWKTRKIWTDSHSAVCFQKSSLTVWKRLVKAFGFLKGSADGCLKESFTLGYVKDELALPIP